jgi:hypothetical protein
MYEDSCVAVSVPLKRTNWLVCAGSRDDVGFVTMNGTPRILAAPLSCSETTSLGPAIVISEPLCEPSITFTCELVMLMTRWMPVLPSRSV